jgi:hypothetical protein
VGPEEAAEPQVHEAHRGRRPTIRSAGQPTGAHGLGSIIIVTPSSSPSPRRPTNRAPAAPPSHDHAARRPPMITPILQLSGDKSGIRG